MMRPRRFPIEVHETGQSDENHVREVVDHSVNHPSPTSPNVSIVIFNVGIIRDICFVLMLRKSRGVFVALSTVSQLCNNGFSCVCSLSRTT